MFHEQYPPLNNYYIIPLHSYSKDLVCTCEKDTNPLNNLKAKSLNKEAWIMKIWDMQGKLHSLKKFCY